MPGLGVINKTADDYIPMSNMNMMNNPQLCSGPAPAQLMKPVVRSEEEKENELHIPLTPSPDLMDHNGDVFSKLTSDSAACGAVGYNPANFPVFSYPPYNHPNNQTLNLYPPQNIPAGYFTPPFQTLSPAATLSPASTLSPVSTLSPASTISPVSTPQSHMFDPNYPHLPNSLSTVNTAGLQGDFVSRHLPALPLLKPPPAKRLRTTKGKRSLSNHTANNSCGACRAHNAALTSPVLRKVNEMKTTLLEYHTAGSEELWRPGGEPRKKNKSCQTTFKQPLQLASYEEFASLAILLRAFHKEAVEDAGNRYGVKSKG